MPLSLPGRTSKKRDTGITAITDKGIPYKELDNILECYQDYIDIAKLGIGTAIVETKLTEKLAVYNKYDIEVYFGGTLFEKFYAQGLLEDYLALMKDNNIGSIEISNAIVDFSIEDRVALVKKLVPDFTVYAEVGGKDNETIMAPYIWVDEIKQLLDAGCTKVITEGRDSGTAGLFRPTGEVREGLLDEIVNAIPPEHLIFEAPTETLQMHFINKFGPNVNLGNILVHDLLVLETQRQGLRYETFELS